MERRSNDGQTTVKAQLKSDFEAAKHVAFNGKTYATPRAWKFNSLIHDFKQMNPFQP